VGAVTPVGCQDKDCVWVVAALLIGSWRACLPAPVWYGNHAVYTGGIVVTKLLRHIMLHPAFDATVGCVTN